MKKKLDPHNLMNPFKVFGGRVTAGRKSLLAGFTAGYAVAFAVLLLGAYVTGISWLTQLIYSSIIPIVAIPNLIFFALLGGFIGLLVIKFMTLNQALAVGIPMLRILSKILRK